MKHYKKHYIEIELLEYIELEEIKIAIEDTLLMVIKETELADGLRWHIAEIE